MKNAKENIIIKDARVHKMFLPGINVIRMEIPKHGIPLFPASFYGPSGEKNGRSLM
ncbi:MAG TPA: hypothetical protein PKL96_02070 [Bacteroidales bacterium]|nr:hypothetical protein [Bacteroidales bacterium]